jgi:hypothetical protein
LTSKNSEEEKEDNPGTNRRRDSYHKKLKPWKREGARIKRDKEKRNRKKGRDKTLYESKTWGGKRGVSAGRVNGLTGGGGR